MKKPLIRWGLITLGVMIVLSIVLDKLTPTPKRSEQVAPSEQQEAGLAPALANCSTVGAYVIAKQWVQFEVGQQRLVFHPYDDSYVTHDPANDVYQVRAEYFTEAHDRGEYFCQVRCQEGSWKTDLLTLNGRQILGSDEWSKPR